MKIIIDIPDKIFHRVCQDYLNYTETTEGQALKAISEGTPLPKGRGRMIILSEDAVKGEQQMPLSFSHQKWISEVGLSNATVAIIEADTESEDRNGSI